MTKLGIDLGTTRSAAGLMEAGDPTLVMNENGDRIIPSLVYFRESGEVLVGKEAKNNLQSDSERIVREIKRHMGEEEFTETVGDEEYTPKQVSSEIIDELVGNAHEFVDGDIEELVITVPAYFTADQKRDTREAAELVGFDEKEVSLLHEPTAAAIAYGYDRDRDETVLVYDFGGGTLDISVMDVDGNDFSTLAISGDTSLGGEDFTRAILDLLADEYEEENGLDLREDTRVRENLRQVAEDAKISLSGREQVEISAPLLGQVDGEYVGIEDRVFTREEFENEVDDLIEDAIDPIEEALDKGDLETDDIDSVILVGGSSKIPAIKNRVKDFFKIDPESQIDLDRIVARGAAIVAGDEDRNPSGTTMYQCPTCSDKHDKIGGLFAHIATEHGVESCPFPDCGYEATGPDDLTNHMADTHGAEIPTTTDVDETEDEDDKIEIGDIVPRPIGTDVQGGKMDVILEDGMKRPAENTRKYTTTTKNQTEMPVNIYEGESEYYENNIELHSWSIEGIPAMDAGEPVLEVTFEMDRDGVLDVTAEEVKSGTKATTTIDPSGKDVDGEDAEKRETNDGGE